MSVFKIFCRRMAISFAHFIVFLVSLGLILGSLVWLSVSGHRTALFIVATILFVGPVIYAWVSSIWRQAEYEFKYGKK